MMTPSSPSAYVCMNKSLFCSTREISIINCLTNASYWLHWTQSDAQLGERSEVHAAVFPRPNRHVASTGLSSSFSGPLRMVTDRGLGVVNIYACNFGMEPMPLSTGEVNSTEGTKVSFWIMLRFSVFASLIKMDGNSFGSITR